MIPSFGKYRQRRCSPLLRWATPLFALICFFSASALFAQNACTALPVCDSVFVQPNINQGGNAFPPSSCLRSIRNPVWYRIRIARDGFLGFTLELSPEDQVLDDYDFAVFNATGGKTCDDLTLFDERSCNYAEKPGNTGANGMTESNSQNSRGTNFNARIPVKAGEEYLILISNYRANPRSKGYRLNFSSSTPNIIDRTTTPENASRLASVDVPQGACAMRSCRVKFTTDIRCASLSNQTFVIQASNNEASEQISCQIIPSERCQSSTENFEREFTVQFAVPLTQSGQYSLRIQRPLLDLCGNAVMGTTTFTVQLNPQPLTVRVGGYDYFCSGASTYLFADIAQGQNYKYEWLKNGVVLPSEQRNFLIANELAEYSLFVLDTLTGCSAGANIRIRNENDFKPRIQPSPTVNLCSNDSTRLDAGADLEQIQWFFRGFPLGNERSRYLQVSSGGEYSVRAVRNGCEGTSDAVRVNLLPVPSLSQTSNFFTVRGNSVTCNIPAVRYEWSLDGQTLDKTTSQTHTGQSIVPPRSGKLSVRLFTDAGCSIQSTLAVPPLDFTRLSVDAILRIPDTLKSAQNTLVSIPLLLKSTSLNGLRSAGVTGFRARLRMNARLLSLEDKRITSDSVHNLERSIHVSMDLPQQFSSDTSSLLDTIRFRAMLGNSSATTILLENIETIPLASMATISAQHGLFTLTNISTRATIRLITSATTNSAITSMIISLKTAPNPAQESTVIQYEVSTVSKEPLPIMLTLTDTFGRLIYTAPHRTITVSDGRIMIEEQIDTHNFPQGVYLLALYMGAERVSRRVEVVR